jgi:hypothetical protein
MFYILAVLLGTKNDTRKGVQAIRTQSVAPNAYADAVSRATTKTCVQ